MCAVTPAPNSRHSMCKDRPPALLPFVINRTLYWRCAQRLLCNGAGRRSESLRSEYFRDGQAQAALTVRFAIRQDPSAGSESEDVHQVLARLVYRHRGRAVDRQPICFQKLGLRIAAGLLIGSRVPACQRSCNRKEGEGR